MLKTFTKLIAAISLMFVTSSVYAHDFQIYIKYDKTGSPKIDSVDVTYRDPGLVGAGGIPYGQQDRYFIYNPYAEMVDVVCVPKLKGDENCDIHTSDFTYLHQNALQSALILYMTEDSRVHKIGFPIEPYRVRIADSPWYERIPAYFVLEIFPISRIANYALFDEDPYTGMDRTKNQRIVSIGSSVLSLVLLEPTGFVIGMGVSTLDNINAVPKNFTLLVKIFLAAKGQKSSLTKIVTNYNKGLPITMDLVKYFGHDIKTIIDLGGEESVVKLLDKIDHSDLSKELEKQAPN